MGTRSGDIDPSIVVFLQRHGLDADSIEAMLNSASGLLGLSGFSDMRDVGQAAEQGQTGARLALDMAAHRLAKYIGAYNVAAGGAHALVFTGRMGEHGRRFRARTARHLEPLSRPARCDGARFDDDCRPPRSCPLGAPPSLSGGTSPTRNSGAAAVGLLSQVAAAAATYSAVRAFWPYYRITSSQNLGEGSARCGHVRTRRRGGRQATGTRQGTPVTRRRHACAHGG
ncbi:hypothetical protein ASG77_00050 [Arthrobacter sp. Soil762]|nr:hypothetical protein ASG77_00050 [Arthrobacter sp. Soil762]